MEVEPAKQCLSDGPSDCESPFSEGVVIGLLISLECICVPVHDHIMGFLGLALSDGLLDTWIVDGVNAEVVSIKFCSR